jgi:hypothetical protein
MIYKTLLSTSLFPPVPWMAVVVQFPESHVEIHETWLKQTFRNRFTILSANGPLDLHIPVIKPNGNHSKTSDVLVSLHDNPLRKIKNAVESAYHSSPYFDFFSDALNEFLNQEHRTIHELNMESIRCIENMLQFQFKLQCTQNFHPPENIEPGIIDLRYILSPKNKLFYLHKAPSYYQVFKSRFGFVSNLSVLDLVMNAGPETLLYLQNYPLDHFFETILKKQQ